MPYLKRILLFLVLLCSVVLSQANSLQMGVRTNYSPAVTTVGQAAMYVLAATDYKLAAGYPASRSAVAILSRPIPPEAIQDKVMPIYKALLLLIGNDNLIIDTTHHLVTFDIH
jgi:hypothetical protein